MICKLINLINTKLEETYDTRIWFTTIIQVIVLDAIIFLSNFSANSTEKSRYICFDTKILIDCERNAVGLDDQRDSK